MSRNYELLKRMEKTHLLTAAGTHSPGTEEVVVQATDSALTEEISRLVNRLFFSGYGAGPGVLSFAGIRDSDRSSWICMRAGETLARQTNRPVCVVEANFRAPNLYKTFGLNNAPGLRDALAGESPIGQYTVEVARNLFVLPAGNGERDPATHLERLRGRFLEIRKKFGHVLVSGPPMFQETDATLIGQMADGVVLVVQANRTARKEVLRAKENLQNARVKLLGAVLDERESPVPAFISRWL